MTLRVAEALADRTAKAALEGADPREVACPNSECDGIVDAQRVTTGRLASACCGNTYAELRDAATPDTEQREPMANAYQFEVGP